MRRGSRPSWLRATRLRRATPTSDRKSTRLNSSHLVISYAVFCLKKKKETLCSAHVLPRPLARWPAGPALAAALPLHVLSSLLHLIDSPPFRLHSHAVH